MTRDQTRKVARALGVDVYTVNFWVADLLRRRHERRRRGNDDR